MKFNKPINREAEINNETFVVTMDGNGVSFRVKGKRKSLRAEWSAILFIARAEVPEAERQETGQRPEHEEETAPGAASRGASAGDVTPVS
jgi:hypothetical protein